MDIIKFTKKNVKKLSNNKKLCELLSNFEKTTLEIDIKKSKPAGNSKFGGGPLLPENFKWPEFTGEDYSGIKKTNPLAFLLQIDLAEINHFGFTELPKKGILSFFYDTELQPWGFDLSDRGCSAVYYFENIEELSLKAVPEEVRFPEAKLSFKLKKSLPDYDELEYIPGGEQIIRELDGNFDLYFDTLKSLGAGGDETETRTKLLGYPDVIQSAMQEECELVTCGNYLGHGHPEMSPEKRETIQKAAQKWKLLLQMGTVELEDFELMFGDCGQIYFWIKEDELRKRSFDRTWLILQCG